MGGAVKSSWSTTLGRILERESQNGSPSLLQLGFSPCSTETRFDPKSRGAFSHADWELETAQIRAQIRPIPAQNRTGSATLGGISRLCSRRGSPTQLSGRSAQAGEETFCWANSPGNLAAATPNAPGPQLSRESCRPRIKSSYASTFPGICVAESEVVADLNFPRNSEGSGGNSLRPQLSGESRRSDPKCLSGRTFLRIYGPQAKVPSGPNFPRNLTVQTSSALGVQLSQKSDCWATKWSAAPTFREISDTVAEVPRHTNFLRNLRAGTANESPRQLSEKSVGRGPKQVWAPTFRRISRLAGEVVRGSNFPENPSSRGRSALQAQLSGRARSRRPQVPSALNFLGDSRRSSLKWPPTPTFQGRFMWHEESRNRAEIVLRFGPSGDRFTAERQLSSAFCGWPLQVSSRANFLPDSGASA